MRVLLPLLLPLLLVGCDALAVPTITPTRTLSGPTLAPTDNVIPRPPTEVARSFEDGFGASDPTAAGLPNDLNLPPLAITVEGSVGGAQIVQITTDAERVLVGELYANVPVRAPGVLLVGVGREAWGTLPSVLEANGYVSLVVAPPPNTTVTEFGQVVGSFADLGLSDTARLDPGRIAVIGEGAGAALALRGCTPDPRCDALALFGPTGEGLSPLVTAYGARPLLVAGGATAEGLAAAALGEVTLLPFASGADDPALQQALAAWLARHLRG